MTAPSQANITISPVMSDQKGSFMCYSSHNTFSYLLSHPGNPLEPTTHVH